VIRAYEALIRRVRTRSARRSSQVHPAVVRRVDRATKRQRAVLLPFSFVRAQAPQLVRGCNRSLSLVSVSL